MNPKYMKLHAILLFLLFYSIKGFCQEPTSRPRNVFLGSLKINSAAPAVFFSYERVLLRKEQIDFGLFLSANATRYKEHRVSNFIQPYFSIGILISEILNEKNRIEGMVGGDIHPFNPLALYFHGKLAYTHYIPKPKIGLRVFIMAKVDTDYRLYVEDPSSTQKNQIVPTRFYWCIGLAFGKYF